MVAELARVDVVPLLIVIVGMGQPIQHLPDGSALVPRARSVGRSQRSCESASVAVERVAALGDHELFVRPIVEPDDPKWKLHGGRCVLPAVSFFDWRRRRVPRHARGQLVLRDGRLGSGTGRRPARWRSTSSSRRR